MIALLVIFGCALAAPTPKVDDLRAQLKTENTFKSAGNVIREMETSLDGIDDIFVKKSFLPGSYGRGTNLTTL